MDVDMLIKMDNNIKNKYTCYYCNKECSSNFILKEHISYGHRNLIEFENSNINKKLISRIKMLEEYIKLQANINDNLLKRIKELEDKINLYS